MIDLYFNPQGRVSQKGYFVAYLLPWLFFTQFLNPVLAGAGLAILGVMIGFFFLWPGYVAVPVKRLHDGGLSGWFHAGAVALQILCIFMIARSISEAGITIEQLQAIQVLPTAEQSQALRDLLDERPISYQGFLLLALVIVAEFSLLMLLPSQDGPNRFGKDPRESGRGFAD